MKLLTLISGKEVKIAPGVNVIPRDEFTRILEAKELLAEIKHEAIEQRAEIAKEGERLFEESKHKGFKEGLAQWSEQIKLLEDERHRVRKEIEKVIAKVALITTKKIIDRELKQDPATIIDIISKNLKSITSHRHIEIYVNKKDLEILQENRLKLREIFEQVESLTLQARDDITEGGAIIETEAGIIDARVENLWVTIENTFEDLFNRSNK